MVCSHTCRLFAGLYHCSRDTGGSFRLTIGSAETGLDEITLMIATHMNKMFANKIGKEKDKERIGFISMITS
jgi:hypothetical protein